MSTQPSVPALSGSFGNTWRSGAGLTTKLMVVVGLACMLIFAGLAVFSVQLVRHEREAGATALRSRSEALVASLAQLDDASRKAAQQSFSVLSDRLPLVLFSMADVGDGKPKLQHAGYPLEGNTEAVDAFASLTGGVATVFQREGDDFRRITTSLKKEDGTRAVNTLLDRDHPAYALMLDGKPYVGRAVLFGKTYMAQYEPVRVNEKVVGILFIGHSMESQFQSLQQSFKLAGDEGVTTLAIDVKEGPRKGFVVAAESTSQLDSGSPLMHALQGVAQSSMHSGVLSGIDVVPGLAGSGVANVGWARFDPWGWVVVQAQRDAATVAQAWQHLWLLWSLIAGGSVVAAAAVLIALRRMVLFPLRDLLADVDQLSRKDYSRPLVPRTRDELGQFILALEGMRRQLSANMRQMEQSAKDIDAVAAEVARGNIELGSRTENAAGNLQQSASSLGHLTDAVNHSANASRQANQLASTAAEVAARGGDAVHQVVSTMQDIHHSSQKIADIIGVIDSIAFQTNILALNAAVEAARAGEAGRGFAVVASEVRNLAGRSAQAAKEIKDLITTSVDRVQSGTQQVERAGQTMQEIVASVQRVTDVIGEITAAAVEQSAGIGQVNSAVGALDHMTQQNAALVEEVAAAADNLSHQTKRLREALGQYKTGNDGLADGDLHRRQLVRVGTGASRPASTTKPVQPGLPSPRAHSDGQAPRLGGHAETSKNIAFNSIKSREKSQNGTKFGAQPASGASAKPAAHMPPKDPGRPAVPLGGDWETF